MQDTFLDEILDLMSIVVALLEVIHNHGGAPCLCHTRGPRRFGPEHPDRGGMMHADARMTEEDDALQVAENCVFFASVMSTTLIDE